MVCMYQAICLMNVLRKESRENMAKRKKTKRFSLKEIQAYWVGVGISSERHKESGRLLDSNNSKIKNSVRSGYNADNYKDVSKKFR